ncbi:hypothetical protein MOSE0_M00540 [Monosporozyma servazzii]
MQAFENGYNRTEEDHDNVIGYQYVPVKILDVPEPANRADGSQIETVPCINFEKRKEPANVSSSTPDSYDYSRIQTPQSITNVFDSKNQLTSLIKNAQQNEDSLKERNKRVSQAKQQSKRQYGW